MHGSDEFDTAQMLKRLQRQVSRLRGGDTDESVTIVLITQDETVASDTVSATLETSTGFTWGDSAWSMDRW